MSLDPDLLLLHQTLREHPEGLREYDLLEILRGDAPLRGLGPMELFRVHFLLFHHLYRLQAWLEAQGAGTLEIHCLSIRLSAGQRRPAAGESLPQAPDPLAAYYLNLDNLRRTSEEDVQELLRSFWRRFKVYGRREEALEALGLGPKATALEIRKRFRELSRRLHPDKGGDSGEFQRVAAAMDVLRVLGCADP